jgi:hypothetical protein
MTTGENTGTWGNVTNVNLGTALEEAIVGSVNVTFSSADVTLTLTDTNAAQTARNMRLVLTGTSGGARQLVVPAVEKIYIVKNDLADICTVKVSGQTGVAVPAGKTMWLCNDGTDVKDVVTHLSSLTLGSALPAASGGTGVTSPGTAGNVLVSSGSAWASQALNTFSTGMILLWSGSIATIPSGWALCDGTNGTPNLRDRFIVGAGNTYAVDATGGSADAIVVSHTHTASVTDPGHTHTLSPANRQVYNSGASGSAGQYNGGETFTQLTMSSATTGITVGISTTGSSGTNANLPPYYALAYIMKL